MNVSLNYSTFEFVGSICKTKTFLCFKNKFPNHLAFTLGHYLRSCTKSKKNLVIDIVNSHKLVQANSTTIVVFFASMAKHPSHEARRWGSGNFIGSLDEKAYIHSPSIHSFIHSFILLYIHSFIHSFFYIFIHSFIRLVVWQGTLLFQFSSLNFCLGKVRSWRWWRIRVTSAR